MTYVVTANHHDNACRHHCLSAILTSCLASDHYGVMAHIVLASADQKSALLMV